MGQDGNGCVESMGEPCLFMWRSYRDTSVNKGVGVRAF